MSTQAPQTIHSNFYRKMESAINRARTEKIVVYQAGEKALGVATVTNGMWVEKPYTLSVHGDSPLDVSCDCPAGQTNTICKHRAAGIYARKHHVFAVHPATAPAPVAGRRDPLRDLFE